MKFTAHNNQKGFTLIELLVVIGILAVLLAITFVAVNPTRQIALANNAKRSGDINAMLGAVTSFIAENQGTLPAGIAAGNTDIPISSAVGGTGAAFCNALSPRYIAAFPADPTASGFNSCADYATGYTITVSTPAANDTSRITIEAPSAELQQTISVTR